jgi:hypothetical protein
MGGITQNRAMTAAHSTPQATPTVTITTRLPQATITVQAPPKVVTKTVTRTIKVPQATITCGRAEDDCYPDYIGKGRWVIRHGERPMPKATVAGGKKSTLKKTEVQVPGVCRHPSIITRGQLQDCIKLAGRPKVVKEGQYEIPNGRVLVRECTDQYKGSELSACLKQ